MRVNGFGHQGLQIGGVVHRARSNGLPKVYWYMAFEFDRRFSIFGVLLAPGARESAHWHDRRHYVYQGHDPQMLAELTVKVTLSVVVLASSACKSELSSTSIT